jgi:hypothetical protein
MQNKGPALAPVSLSSTLMMPDSPPEFSTTTPRRGETGTAPQVGTLANKADFFEQALNRIPSFPKPRLQTPFEVAVFKTVADQRRENMGDYHNPTRQRGIFQNTASNAEAQSLADAAGWDSRKYATSKQTHWWAGDLSRVWFLVVDLAKGPAARRSLARSTTASPNSLS